MCPNFYTESVSTFGCQLESVKFRKRRSRRRGALAQARTSAHAAAHAPIEEVLPSRLTTMTRLDRSSSSTSSFSHTLRVDGGEESELEGAAAACSNLPTSAPTNQPKEKPFCNSLTNLPEVLECDQEAHDHKEDGEDRHAAALPPKETPDPQRLCVEHERERVEGATPACRCMSTAAGITVVLNISECWCQCGWRLRMAGVAPTAGPGHVAGKRIACVAPASE